MRGITEDDTYGRSAPSLLRLEGKELCLRQKPQKENSYEGLETELKAEVSMKKGTTVKGKIEYTEFPNKGIMKVMPEDGEENKETERVIVKGTIPGQTVNAVINKGRKGKFEARLLKVLEKSELETQLPFCPHFDLCGGCFYQTLEYEAQLELKAEQVKKLIDTAVGLYENKAENESSYIWEKPVASPKRTEYRNKMEFTFGNEYKDGPLVIGLHKKGSFYDIVPVHECGLMNSDMRNVLKATEEWARESGLGFYHKMTKQGYFRHLLVRRSAKSGSLLIDLVTCHTAEKDGGKMTEAENREVLDGLVKVLLNLECKSRIAGILHTRNDSVADAIIDQGTEILYGQGFFTEELLGLNFKITPFSFFQTNSLGAEKLYEKAREYVSLALSDKSDGPEDSKKAGVLYDLYSGTGTIGQLMSAAADKVYGIEIVEEAVTAANENAVLNGLDNCKFIAGDVFKKLDELEEKPDIIILDPPREGIVAKSLIKILSYGVKNMVYISCKPTSLANDLAMIQEAGYMVVKACCVDMFPYTTNVETVVWIRKNES